MTDTMSLRNAQEREAAAQRAKVERANREEADWQLYCADPEGARQRAAAERAQREGVIYRQQQPNWSAFWVAVDKRVTEAVAAQYSFTKDQQELLFDILKDARDAMRGEISKAIEEARRTVDARFETLERRVRAPGALPPVKTWRQGAVIYEGELVVFDGELFQAKTDTGLQPGDEGAFICAARRGRDAAQVTPKGSWSASIRYDMLDLVNYQDCSYLATRSNPGKPGDGEGWQVIAARGPKGDLGSRGPRGARGDRGAAETPVTIVGWSLDIEDYRAFPVLNNGEIGASLDLRPLFEQFCRETGTA
jgi:hypothetical protein